MPSLNRGFTRDPRYENNPNKTANNKLDRKTTGRILRRLLGYVLKEWPLFVCAVILTLLSNQLSLLGPRYSGKAINAIAAEGGVQFDIVWENVLRMLICYASSALMAYILAVLMIRFSQKIVYRMRRQLFA